MWCGEEQARIREEQSRSANESPLSASTPAVVEVEWGRILFHCLQMEKKAEQNLYQQHGTLLTSHSFMQRFLTHLHLSFLLMITHTIQIHHDQ